MDLSVATNFEPDLIEALKGLPVTELFGKLPSDAVGGGRASYMLAPTRWSQLEAHVRQAAAAGIGFNYLLNPACMGNREFTRPGQRDIRRLLDRISEIGVGAVTVAIPFLLELIKKGYPHLRVKVGVYAKIDNVPKAKFWEELGADEIHLESLAVNRDFPLLAEIRRAVRCGLRLIANANCLQFCPLAAYHMVGLSHASRRGESTRGFMIDYCILRCSELKLREPVNYLRSEWIRPEDVPLYEELGYDRFKILERNAPTPALARRARAYAERRYDGNLLDLIQPFGYREAQPGLTERGLYRSLRFFFRPRLVNPLRFDHVRQLARLRSMLDPLMGEPPVWIENSQLDGFIERFRQNDGCRTTACDRCRHCHEFAARAVRIDPGHQKEALALYDQIFEDLLTGRMWRYP